ncbi:MAG: hypothetical protein KZQ70_06265 [gamma proteobacterium symbiont of Lucinoma myriamae]|nr:hypothetical protein [gamma proteobacterium symbiont of Lucinoma myriamae]MCU7818502.1 hypothetical protein [gamma proteobacterium symbiont of Lucinoma myriamae]MCU7832112.1 hypothetical protein [gamma proteobacterium symbiont of Lucinoma myriamae]
MLNKEFHRSDYLYTALFCEENIWQLIHSLSSDSIAMNKMWCLIITNPAQKIPLLNQQAASQKQAVIWDYHVILLASINHQPVIFDFDTSLGFVTPLDEYLRHTFIFSDKEPVKLPEELIPYIRKIPAESYLNNFYSDRSHMLNQITASEYPPWPVINETKTHCTPLADYLNINQSLSANSSAIKVNSFAAVKQRLISALN